MLNAPEVIRRVCSAKLLVTGYYERLAESFAESPKALAVSFSR